MTKRSRPPFRPETIAAHAGQQNGRTSGPAVAPIEVATTYLRDEHYCLAPDGRIYGRDENGTVAALEQLVAELEGAAHALAFSSGMAAIAALVRTLERGQGLVIQRGIYWGTTQWVRTHCGRRGIALLETDATDKDTLVQGIEESRPALVFVETPSNPFLGIVDIRAAARAAHGVGAVLAVDSTLATPILTNPHRLGADIVMHSATKALNGHSDVVAGLLTANDPDNPVWKFIEADRHDTGAILSGFEAYMLMRGMRTLGLRVPRMCENAMQIAAYLGGRAEVSEVLYPGLDIHRGHETAGKQMLGGYGGLLSFRMRDGIAGALDFCGRLKLIKRATSLGGVESLIEHRYSVEGEGSEAPPDLLRLSLGIEHVDDLIDDLERAFEGAAAVE